MMPSDFTFDEVDHILGNVRGAVANSLDMPANRKEVEGWFDQVGPRTHYVEQIINHAAVVFVDLVIAAADLAGGIYVLVDERVERFMHHLRCANEHPLELAGNLKLWILGERN